MMTPDPNMVAAYGRALARAGLQVTIKRVTGFAPNPVVELSVTVQAIVRDYQPDTSEPSEMGYAPSKVGGITQGDRLVIVMASDLATARFPLPLMKNDKIIIVSTGDELNVVDVDAFKRVAAGAIELKAAGVQ